MTRPTPTEIGLEAIEPSACSASIGEHTQPPMRTHCLAPSECKAKSPTTHCRSCTIKHVTRDPTLRQKMLDAIQVRYAQPGAREKRAEDMRAVSKRNWSDPKTSKRMRAAGKAVVHLTAQSPKCLEAAQSPEAKTKRVESNRRTRYGWCPPDRFEEYRSLVHSGIRAAEARRIIEETIPGTAAHAARMVANADLQMRLKHERDVASRY